ncbi:MAG: hypothetical protein HW373_1681 [Deltaproteobacteria bacterium]|nr:hypothetical protein [Deltaproteobacteria bacterium]
MISVSQPPMSGAIAVPILYVPCKLLIKRPRWLRRARSMAAISRAVDQRLSAAPMQTDKSNIIGNHGATAHSSAAPHATNGPPTNATRVPLRSSSIPATMVPKNLPITVAVTICAAPPAETPNSRPSTGIVGMIIAQAPDIKVPE